MIVEKTGTRNIPWAVVGLVVWLALLAGVSLVLAFTYHAHRAHPVPEGRQLLASIEPAEPDWSPRWLPILSVAVQELDWGRAQSLEVYKVEREAFITHFTDYAVGRGWYVYDHRHSYRPGFKVVMPAAEDGIFDAMRPDPGGWVAQQSRSAPVSQVLASDLVSIRVRVSDYNPWTAWDSTTIAMILTGLFLIVAPVLWPWRR